jgi:hypothetical protein
VSEEWLVDGEGNFIAVVEQLEVVYHPTIDNIWTCAECGEEAEVQ